MASSRGEVIDRAIEQVLLKIEKKEDVEGLVILLREMERLQNGNLLEDRIKAIEVRLATVERGR